MLYPCELTGNLVSSALAVIKSSDKSNLKRDLFYLIVEVYSIMGGKSRQQRLEAATHIMSEVRRAVSACMHTF